jgi:hypothetical protein
MIHYTTGINPTSVGVYACRVQDGDLLKDIFLMWFDGRWGYLGSDQRYRGEVAGWAGPLARKL